jgi:hypothetical protein
MVSCVQIPFWLSFTNLSQLTTSSYDIPRYREPLTSFISSLERSAFPHIPLLVPCEYIPPKRRCNPSSNRVHSACYDIRRMLRLQYQNIGLIEALACCSRLAHPFTAGDQLKCLRKRPTSMPFIWRHCVPILVRGYCASCLGISGLEPCCMSLGDVGPVATTC